MNKRLQTLVLSMVLALASLPAWALGLGQLQLKSKLGQPLLAEIPVVSADPQELQNLQARLAAPDTFLRVGLPLPDKMVSDLRFELAYDAANRPFIRVTSPVPVAMPMLTFLLEVDWGDGRLVREYSVLLAEPEAVAAAAQPVIEAPEISPSTAIVRDAEPVATAPMPAPAPAPTPQPAPAAPVPVPAAVPAQPVAVAPPPPAAMSAAQGNITVQRGDTLSALAANAGMRGAEGIAWMAAVLRANPEAFIQGNANRLRRDARLVLPDADALAQASRDGSADALRAQLGGAMRSVAAVDVANEPEASPARPAPAAAQSAPAQAEARPRIRRDARLQITPAVAAASAAQAGGRSGTGGEGDGEMTQQLQEARETIATRDAEVAELKSRVDELESLQKQQAQLIQMKDGQLASVQQKLQQRQQEVVPAATPAGASSMWGWLGLAAIVLLAAAVLAWWLRRRPHPVVESATPGFARNVPARAPVVAAPEPEADADEGIAPPPASIAAAVPAAALFPETTLAASPKTGETWAANAASSLRKPSWMAAGTTAPTTDDTVVPDLRREDTRTGVPKWLNRAEDGASRAPTLAPGQGVFDPPPPEQEARVEASSIDAESAERVALARTYIELGDENTARILLQQVVDRGGPQAVIARRMLDGDAPA